MLKISYDENAADAATLKLEGQVAGRWVHELRQAYAERRRNIGQALTVDLKDVTFIDSAGVAFFNEIWAHIRVVNCSLFAAEQLKDVLSRRQEVR